MKISKDFKLIASLILIEGITLPITIALWGSVTTEEKFTTLLTTILSHRADLVAIVSFPILRLLFCSWLLLYIFTQLRNRYRINHILQLSLINMFSNVAMIGSCYAIGKAIYRYTGTPFMAYLLIVTFTSPLISLALPYTRELIKEATTSHIQ